MSALGQKQTSRHVQPMSALPPKADIDQHGRNVCFVPKADIGTQPPDVRFVPKADIGHRNKKRPIRSPRRQLQAVLGAQ